MFNSVRFILRTSQSHIELPSNISYDNDPIKTFYR